MKSNLTENCETGVNESDHKRTNIIVVVASLSWGSPGKCNCTCIDKLMRSIGRLQAGLLTPLPFARHRLSPLAGFTYGA